MRERITRGEGSRRRTRFVAAVEPRRRTRLVAAVEPPSLTANRERGMRELKGFASSTAAGPRPSPLAVVPPYSLLSSPFVTAPRVLAAAPRPSPSAAVPLFLPTRRAEL
ncbi:hypothetical protein S245_048993 [Arachis hypogaea]